MAKSTQKPPAFMVHDCALAALATGKRAQSLRELRELLRGIHPGCIYYHFWGVLLRPRFDNPEYLNDFAEWARHGLHDHILAERLAVINPAEFSNMEDLRDELLEEIEQRLDETESVPWSKPDQEFHFIRTHIVVFDTHRRIEDPKDLAMIVPQMSQGSIFYHFIDARRRTADAVDDFQAWIKPFGDEYDDLVKKIRDIDPYFVTLRDLRAQLADVMKQYFRGKKK
ncbi:MAG: DUF5752 family protein [Candidatus Hydrogenedentota bacterium]